MSHGNARVAAGSGKGRGSAEKPLSPHLQIWRWHVTMLGSILHRISGIALYVGTALVVGWAVATALGPDAYAAFAAAAGSPFGLVIWLGLSAAAFYHLAAGIRHLVWDLGLFMRPASADVLTVLSILFATAATAGLWGWLFWTGAVSL